MLKLSEGRNTSWTSSHYSWTAFSLPSAELRGAHAQNMAPDPGEKQQATVEPLPEPATNGPPSTVEQHDEDEVDDDEPKLKYTRLTGNLASVYRGGDATSSFIVAGDKMVRAATSSFTVTGDKMERIVMR